jgi:UDPglucose--hexose-1-phosphate uridylyltransferase
VKRANYYGMINKLKEIILALFQHQHRRLNILTGEWILVSPHRAQRPWLGQKEQVPDKKLPEYDPACYLCPGNDRAGGLKNPEYDSTFVFQNDFSALLPDSPSQVIRENELLSSEGERGLCNVMCFSPRHDLTLAEMDEEAIQLVIRTWSNEYKTIGALPYINHVQIFENKGELMGCSNPHPHCQIWAQESIPTEPAKEIARMNEYRKRKKSCILCDYLSVEMKEGERIIFENDDFSVLVPFWATWPFEAMILPKRHMGSILEMTAGEQSSFANAIKRLTTRYDNIFNISFPYSSGIHQPPTDGNQHPEYHFHMHFYPPLLRSASIKKFMVGYEMLANPQRDILPESSADNLRSLSDLHFKFR